MKLYQYLFYKFYSLSKLMETGNIVSAANAYFMVSILLGLNILGAMCVVNLLLGKIIFTGFTFYILLFFPLVFVYYGSLYKQKYLISNKLFKDQSRERKIVGTVFVIIYCVTSFWLIYHYGTLMRSRILKIDS